MLRPVPDFPWRPPMAKVATPEICARFGFVTHSYGNATFADATWGGVAVQAGWTFWDEGVAQAVYPNLAPKFPAGVPYLIDRAIVNGASGGWVARRSTNGINVNYPDAYAQLYELKADETALGGTLDVLFPWYGANDGQTAEEAAFFASEFGGKTSSTANSSFEHYIREARLLFPRALFLLMGEKTSDAVAYPYVADGTMDRVRQRIAGTVPGCRFVDILLPSGTAPAGCTLGVDTIHLSANATGYGEAMLRASANNWRG